MTQEAKILISIGLITLAVFVGGIVFLGRSGSPSSTVLSSVDTQLLVREDSYKISTDQALVTVVEFADFQCPACASAQPLVKQLMKDYSASVNFVFRHFPLPQHQNAIAAALAAEAAGEQGKFWEMQDLLFENQSEWSESDHPTEIFNKYAQELGINNNFTKAVDDQKLKDKILRDQNDGHSLGVNSTPTFFVNGKKIDNYSQLKEIIEEELGE